MKPPTWRAWLVVIAAGTVAALAVGWVYIPEFPESVGIVWAEFRAWVARPGN